MTCMRKKPPSRAKKMSDGPDIGLRLPGRGLEGGGPYKPLLRRLAHWLMKEPDLEEEHLAARMTGTKLTIERRSMGGKVPPGDLDRPLGRQVDTRSRAGRARPLARHGGNERKRLL